MQYTSIEELYTIYKKNPVITTDSRNIPQNSIFFSLKGDNFNGNTFTQKALENGASFAVVDEIKYKINNQCLLVADGLQALQELAKYHRKQLQTKVIGITGTNGKTTTKELIYAVLSTKYKTFATQGNLNNHVGVPLSVLAIRPETELAVIEMGANHIGEIADLCKISQPDLGLITNIGKAHLEGFGSYEGIIQAKSELYNYLKSKTNSIFINVDDDILRKISQHMQKIEYSISSESGCFAKEIFCNPFVNMNIEIHQKQLLIKSQLIGAYNAQNIMAAVCIGNYFGVDLDSIKTAIENYKPTNNRSQFARTEKNQLIVDAYNANPTSMEATLKNFSEIQMANKTAIIGDMLELGDESVNEHQAIISILKKYNFNQVILVGKIFHSLDSEFNSFISTEEAYTWIQKNPISNASVLIKGSRGIRLEKLIELL